MIDFSDDFFKDEIKCDFKIPELMKRSWAAQMEVLCVIIDICDRNGLTYYADGGTLLGAVRHQGFIPWDDDIDITMKRDDFNKLIQLLPTELPNDYTWAGLYAKNDDPLYSAHHVSIGPDYDAIPFPEYMKRFHNFPYPTSIDLYPMDCIPRDKEAADMQIETIRIIFSVLMDWKSLADSDQLEPSIAGIENMLNVNIIRNEFMPHQLFRIVDSLSAMYDMTEGDEITNLPFYILAQYSPFKKEWYDEQIYLPFEGIKISAPRNYHEALTALFGDYMTPVKFASLHNYPAYKANESKMLQKTAYLGEIKDITEFCRNFGK